MNMSSRSLKIATFFYPLWFNPPTEGFPWDDLLKIFTEGSQMAKVPNGVETLPKISIA